VSSQESQNRPRDWAASVERVSNDAGYGIEALADGAYAAKTMQYAITALGQKFN
jgi:hypothetical protein